MFLLEIHVLCMNSWEVQSGSSVGQTNFVLHCIFVCWAHSSRCWNVLNEHFWPTRWWLWFRLEGNKHSASFFIRIQDCLPWRLFEMFINAQMACKWSENKFWGMTFSSRLFFTPFYENPNKYLIFKHHWELFLWVWMVSVICSKIFCSRIWTKMVS